MQALVVYESMFGSTHELADAIADGLRSGFEVRVVRADALQDADLDGVDLIVAGGPTHAHSLSTETSRRQAASWTEDPKQHLTLDGPAMSSGLREWFMRTEDAPRRFAAFDTRSDVPRLLSGAASVRIAKELRKMGAVPVVPPESFLVDKYAGLKTGEADRGRVWGARVAIAASGAEARA